MPAPAPIQPSDTDPLSGLFEAHAEELCRMVHRMTGSQQVAEEVVQEVFVTAWKRREDLREIDNPRAWLYRVAVNHVRHRKRSFARLGRFLDRWRSRPDEVSSLPDADLLRLERARRIHRAVNTLSPKQKEVFVLYELQELSGQEVAEILGIKTNTVWGRLRLARESFRAALGPEEAS